MSILSLKDLSLKAVYNSDRDNILDEFYIPCLSQATVYKRISGYFSSTSFALAAMGIANLIMNKGKMKFIVGLNLSEEDFNAVQEGLKNTDKIISETIINDLSTLEDELQKNCIKMLAWMIANNTLELKIAITDKGIFHQKIGILQDDEGNNISFSGSDNETASGWMLNVEEFKVFRSWNEAESKYLTIDLSNFEKFWNDRAERTKVIDLPTAIKDKLIAIAPNSEKEFRLLADFIAVRTKQIKKAKRLRDYQEDAISNWVAHNYLGIFEMATGTGKTFTSINCIKRIFSDKGKGILTVIVCPYTHLVDQWIKELQDNGLDATPIFGSSAKWIPEAERKLADLRLGYRDYGIFVTTYDTFASQAFKDITKNQRALLICDEVHSAGSEERVDYLTESFEFRLGLSATPNRWLDPIGTDKIIKYFGGVVFTFGLKEAINKKFLVPYEYYPHIVELSNPELDEYTKLTRRLGIAYSKPPSEKKDRDISILLIKRRNIVKNAINKLPEFDRLVSGMNEIKYLLVYCSDQQITQVMNMLRNKTLPFHRFTHSESTKERNNILEKFASGEYQILVAMKCLDEGVDVPATETAIILASSGNPKEFIQRRGRILRLSPETGKKKAIIHDIIVIPPKNVFDQGNPKLEKDILRRELERYEEFSRSSMNPLHSTNIIINLIEEYQL